MPLHPPVGAPRERLIITGGPAVGKTSCYLAIAALAHKTGSDSKFFIMDSDNTLPDMLWGKKYKHLDAANGGNIHQYPVNEWPDYVEAADKILAEARPFIDWAVFDSLDLSWPAIRDDYAKYTLGYDRGESQMVSEAMRKGKRGWGVTAEIGQDGWGAIKKEYKRFINPFLFPREGPHVLAISRLQTQGDKPSGRLGAYGIELAGEKDTGYNFRTALYLEWNKSKGWMISTLGQKDRERPHMERQPYTDFALNYLVGLEDGPEWLLK